MRKLTATITLIALLSVPVLAGDINMPPVDPPPASGSAVINAALAAILALIH